MQASVKRQSSILPGKSQSSEYAWESTSYHPFHHANGPYADGKLRQCVYSVFGGHVDVTGEILHGKTSPLRHDSKGLFAGLPQDLPVTRYHSLAGTHPSLPDALEVSSWIASGPDGNKGIMYVFQASMISIHCLTLEPSACDVPVDLVL